jgi:glycosyltransferase involved in cell wall biosynthesis
MYVPDGYEAADWPTLGLAKIGIRTKNYNFTTATSPAEIKTVARAYKNAGMRRKLVVVEELKGQNKRLKRQFNFLHFTGDLGERALQAVMKGAALIILDGGKTTLNTVLTAMDAGKGVVATTSAGYQEVLGVTALMVKAGDSDGLTRAIKQISNNVFRGQLGKKAQKRARAHFTWERILPEYIELYHYPLLRAVNIDSARAKLVAKKA